MNLNTVFKYNVFKYCPALDAAKGSFWYPLMQEKEISAIHGCSKGKFLLPMDAAKGSFFYPWKHEGEVSAIH